MSSLKDVFFHDVTISGSLTKAGDAENLFVDGTTTLRKTLAVDGAATLSDTLTVGQESPYFTGSASMIGHMRHFPYATGQSNGTFGIAELSASLAASASFSAEKINKGFVPGVIAFIFNRVDFQEGLLPVFGDIVHITANGSNSKSESAAIRTKITDVYNFFSSETQVQYTSIKFEDNIINNEHDFSAESEFHITQFTRSLVDGIKMSVTGGAAVYGATTLSGSLTVTGATTLEDLQVNGSTTLEDLQVNGSTTLSGSLTVNGSTTLEDLVVNGSTTLEDLVVNGSASLSGSLTVNGSTTLEDLVVNGSTTLEDLVVNGSTTLSGSLTVTGVTTLNDSLTVNGSTTLSGSLTVTGTTTLSGSLTVTGTTTLVDLEVSGSLIGTINASQIADYAVNSLKLDPVHPHLSPAYGDGAGMYSVLPSREYHPDVVSTDHHYYVGFPSEIPNIRTDHGRVFINWPLVGTTHANHVTYYDILPLTLGGNDLCRGTTYRFISHYLHPAGTYLSEEERVKFRCGDAQAGPGEFDNGRGTELTDGVRFKGVIVLHPSERVWINGVKPPQNPQIKIIDDKEEFTVFGYEAYDITLISSVEEYYAPAVIGGDGRKIIWNVTGTVTGRWATAAVST